MKDKFIRTKYLDIFKQVGNIADNLKLDCYVVGGFVRDLILDKPNDDIDIVVVGSGISVAEEFKNQNKDSTLSIFARYGTAAVKLNNNIKVEFVGARSESYNKNSRKPNCKPGTLKEDQLRRDFTINAMAICLNKSRFGELVDPFGGVEDLKNRRIVTPTDPKITFSDDPLRMLRCIRFAVKLGFDIDPNTWSAIIDNSYRINIVSRERIMIELNKIMQCKGLDLQRGFSMLHSTRLLEHIIPELSRLDTTGKEGYERKHKNIFYHSLQVLGNLSELSDNLWLKWAALLHDIGKYETRRYEGGDKGWTFHDHEHVGANLIPAIFKSLSLPLGSEMKYVQKMVNLHMWPALISTEEITDSAVRKLLDKAGDDIDDLMLLCRSDLTTKNDEKRKRILKQYDKLEEMFKDLKERDYVRLFQPCLTGNDVMEIFNIKPGKKVGEIKAMMKEKILSGEVENNREELIKLVKSWIEKN